MTNIASLRLSSQQLAGTKILNAAEMVSWFGAIQGQEYAQTKWGLGLRLPNLDDSDIEKKLADGTILRTHLLRPTWHFVHSHDISWILDLTAASVHASNAYMYKKLELDHKLFGKCNHIIERILNKQIEMTRDEINKELKKNKIQAEGHRLSYIMMYAELEGIICSGAKRGSQFTYALLSKRISGRNPNSKDAALAELSKRYYQSRGPATVKDFSTWSGLNISICRKGTEMIGSMLEKMVGEGVDYYFAPETHLPKSESSQIYLLPIYDEFIMGYKDRSAIFEFRNSLKKNPSINYDSMIILEGQIIGSWTRQIGKKGIELQYDLFRPMNPKLTSLFNEATRRFGDFHGLSCQVKRTE